MKGVDAIAAIGASGMADMDKLSKWIAKSRLDPNDPDNAELMFLMRVSKKFHNTHNVLLFIIATCTHAW